MRMTPRRILLILVCTQLCLQITIFAATFIVTKTTDTIQGQTGECAGQFSKPIRPPEPIKFFLISQAQGHLLFNQFKILTPSPAPSLSMATANPAQGKYTCYRK